MPLLLVARAPAASCPLPSHLGAGRRRPLRVARLEPHDHRLEGRLVAALGLRVERHQRVGLRVVGAGAAARGVVGDHPEPRGPPLGAVLPLADDVDHLALLEAERHDVVGVHEHHPATVLDAAVAVVEAVDRGVELVVRAHRLQQQPTLGHVQHLGRADGEDRPVLLGGEGAGVARRVRQDEPARLVDLLVVRRAARARPGRSGAGSRCSRRGTRAHGMPWRSPIVASAIEQTMSTSDLRCADAGFSGPCEACTEQTESSTVTRCGRPPVRSFSLRPSAGRISASRPVTTWERLGLVETCTVRSARRRASSVTVVSDMAETKLPPRPKNTLALPSRNALTAATASKPCSRGGSKPNSSRSASRKWPGGRSQMPIVRSPWTLEWPRTGNRPGARLADVALEEGEVGDLLDGGDAVAVLGDAHRPADDRLAWRPRASGRPPRSRRGPGRWSGRTRSQSRARRCSAQASKP